MTLNVKVTVYLDDSRPHMYVVLSLQTIFTFSSGYIHMHAAYMHNNVGKISAHSILSHLIFYSVAHECVLGLRHTFVLSNLKQYSS